MSQEWPQPRSLALSWSPMCPQQSLAGHSSSDSHGRADDWGLPIREDGREWGPRTHPGSGRGRGRCLDRQGSAQRPGPHKGGPGGQCGWEDQASYSATPRPSSSPRTGRARRLAWEPEHVPSIIYASQLSSILVGQVLHHLVQEEHLGPTVAELEDPRQTQLAPETQGGPASWLEPVQELPESPGLELQSVSPASAPAEPEDLPGVAPAPEPGPELEPYVSTAESSSPRTGRARRLAWEPEHVPSIIDASQFSSILVGQVLHHLVQEEHLGPTVAELEDPRQTQLAPETQGGPASWLEPVQELPESPGLELRPVSPASAPAEPEDAPAAASALEAGPELEPHEASGPGPMTPAGMAPGPAEPESDPEPTRPCVTITRDVPRKEERTILQFPAHLVAEQLTLMCAVSGAGSWGRG
ncbi:uncharacterized protein LOC130678942 [Manis pentadactyla]|uniref:uncharacterized protein LOC130678942 n=1 Tax=Manis pentadactyla TaxID=143292 RepID=UPI00255CF16F|nr:uncharacterized protein LOC130678942 [Manis pentadactyla]